MGAGNDKRLILVLGGARSGKSGFAESMAESMPPPRIYLATATALDAEMKERIERHKSRRGAEWMTIEEPIEVAERLLRAGPDGVVLFDCVTLWLTNLLGLSDEEVLERVEAFIEAAKKAGPDIIVVSNDIGSGVVPDNRLARRFVDLAGLANQALAAAADEVHHVTAGIPVRIK